MKTYVYWSLVLSMSILLLTACGPKQIRIEEKPLAENTPDPAQPPPEYYRIGPGDLLDVVVWSEPTLSGAVTVRPDGFITLPLVNEVQVASLTTAQARAQLEHAFGQFVMTPTVAVRVEKISSSEVILLGEVTKPGVYPAMGNASLLHALTAAGGLTRFADRHNIRVVRRLQGKITEYTIDYDAILAGDFQQDLFLRPGDRIIVP